MLLYAVGVVIAGVFGPLTIVHKPVPGDGLFPARVMPVTLQRFCADPALDVTGEA